MDYKKQNRALIWLCIGGYVLLIFSLILIHVYVFSMIISLSQAYLNLKICVELISVTLAYIFGFIFRGMHKTNIDILINQMGQLEIEILLIRLIEKNPNRKIIKFIEDHNKGVSNYETNNK